MQDFAMRESCTVMSAFPVGATLIAQKIVKKDPALMLHHLNRRSARTADILHNKASVDDLPVIQAMNGHLKIRRTKVYGDLLHRLFQCNIHDTAMQPLNLCGRMDCTSRTITFPQGMRGTQFQVGISCIGQSAIHNIIKTKNASSELFSTQISCHRTSPVSGANYFTNTVVLPDLWSCA